MTTSDPIALISTDALAHDTQSEQIRLLYRNAPAGITVNILSALVVTMVLWHHAPVSLLTSLALAVVLVALLRVLLVQRYRRSYGKQYGPLRQISIRINGAAVSLYK